MGYGQSNGSFDTDVFGFGDMCCQGDYPEIAVVVEAGGDTIVISCS